MPMKTKEEQREYQRKWMANRRKEWFDEHGPWYSLWWTLA